MKPVKPHKAIATGRTRQQLKDVNWQLDYACHALKHGKGKYVKDLLKRLDAEYERNIHLENLVKMYES